jgi:hypothetical protein
VTISATTPSPAGYSYGHSNPTAPATCNFVLDLETLGTRPNSAILQIGITCIETKQTLGIQIGEAIASTNEFFGVDAATYDWWLKQDEAVREQVFATGLSHPEALLAIDRWVWEQAAATNVPLDYAIVWANDPEFDCVILKNAYGTYTTPYPFNFRNHRSFRTLHAQMQETVGYSVWSHDAEKRFQDAISGANLPEASKPQKSWLPIKHTAYGDSALEAMAIVAMQNIVYKRGCQMNNLRSSYAGWELELVK